MGRLVYVREVHTAFPSDDQILTLMFRIVRPSLVSPALTREEGSVVAVVTLAAAVVVVTEVVHKWVAHLVLVVVAVSSTSPTFVLP